MSSAAPVFPVGGPPAVGSAAGARSGGGPVTRGHVFVVHGDLTQLACDDVIVPAGAGFEISPEWAALVPPPSGTGSLELTSQSGGSPRWGRLRTSGGVWLLDVGSRDGRRASWYAE